MTCTNYWDLLTVTSTKKNPDTTLDRAQWRNYLELCKPKVVLLMLITSAVGMCLATPSVVDWKIFIWGNLGIALGAGAAAAINHLADRHIDKLMKRTQKRPIVQGKVSPVGTFIFATILCALSMFILIYFVNALTALLTFLSLIAYAGIYTYYLKHATSQNIVIGGIAGASPPLLGWVAVTGHITMPALILVLIIFVWTPPHFWALAIHRVKDYAKANIPMLPNTHGIPYTKLNILVYSIVLAVVTFLPVIIGSSGLIYCIVAVLLNLRFIWLAFKLYKAKDNLLALKTFYFSIIYLALLFLGLLIDHYFLIKIS